MTTYHSKKTDDEIKEIWHKYVLDCDYSLEAMNNSEHIEQVKRICTRLSVDFDKINFVWMEKCKGDVGKIEKLLNNELYLQNQENASLALELSYLFKYFFRLKSRKDRENFELKAENAELKLKLRNYESR